MVLGNSSRASYASVLWTTGNGSSAAHKIPRSIVMYLVPWREIWAGTAGILERHVTQTLLRVISNETSVPC